MTAEIDDEFVDVHFPDDPHFVFGDLGIPFCASFNEYEAADSVLEWSAIDAHIEALNANPEAGLDWLVRRIYNQKNEGSCVGNAATQGTEVVLVKQHGKDRVPALSAISLYKQIGSSPNSGAMVSDAMDKLEEVGVLPLDTPENRAKYGDHVMPPIGFRTPFPSNWKETAAKFRGVEFLIVRSVQALFSALCKGHPVIVGREGHSILYLRPMEGRRVKYVNSWGSWGGAGGEFDKGFGVDTSRQTQKSAGWAFAIRAVNVQGALT